MRDAMSAVSPVVPFSSPPTVFDLRRDTPPFTRNEGERVLLLTQHYFRADHEDPNSTLALLLQPDPNPYRQRLAPHRRLPHASVLSTTGNFS
jgi:hypothetical protein